jgi:hypothetical protein
MEAIKAQVETLEVELEVKTKSLNDVLTELNDLELTLVGGGAGDVNF